MADKKMEKIPPELISKYSRPGPRYTSYPTAAEFSEKFTRIDWEMELQQLATKSSSLNQQLSIYVHIPFCQSLCYYCACNKVIPKTREGIPSYLRAVQREAQLYRGILGDRATIDHIHWGGGTPNFLEPSEIKALHEGILECFSGVTPHSELSVEVDPRTLSLQQLHTFRELGFNRISCGVQDFDPEVQECINRIQSFELTKETISQARAVGFAGVNIDLIYGLPNQTLPSFGNTINKVIEINPDRIALYGYAHVTWVSKAQNSFRRFDIPSPEERVALFSEAVCRLTDAGYLYLGMDHFAKPDDELVAARDNGTLHRNFMGYTSRLAEPLIGLGASSISSTSAAIVQNSKDLMDYETLVFRSELPIVRGVKRTRDDVIRGRLIEQILCDRHIDFTCFEAEAEIPFFDYFPHADTALAAFEADGILTSSAAGFTVTDLGAFFLRNIAMEFDKYLPVHTKNERPVFSQSL